MAFPPPLGNPMFRPGGVPPFPMAPAQPGLIPIPPIHSPVHLPLQPPMNMGPAPMMQRPFIQHTISAPPETNTQGRNSARIPVVSPADMKVATTIFVGNISDKASDTLVRQILLRCGRIEGWKRVQDASGKLQAFGFCEYADPESTLRALRLLHDFRLGEKYLVVKVDSKTRKDLLKYLTRKKRSNHNQPIDDESIEKEVSEIEEKENGMVVLTEDADDEMKEEDSRIKKTIDSLVRENIEVLSSTKAKEDVQLEQDVKESILAMAKQSGKIDPDLSLEDVDMPEDMKTLVSNEIKMFRQSYKRDEEKKVQRKKEERDRRGRDEKERERQRDREKEREREKAKEKERVVSSRDGTQSPIRKERERDRDGGRARSPRYRSPRRERSRSPLKRPRSPMSQSRSQDKERRRERDKDREKEESLREEEEHEERLRARKQREREKGYREKLAVWERREQRKAKEYDKDYQKEDSKREEIDRERRHLAEFLEDYDDEKDDQRYYKGSAYARRRRERELELEEDERDRQREREEIESLRLEVMERQHRQKMADGQDYKEGDESSPEDDEPSPQRREDDEEDMDDIPMRVEVEEDIPLTKAGYPIPSSYPSIQVQSAPAVQPPEIKAHPHDKPVGDGITIGTFELVKDTIKMEEERSSESPQTAPKLAFGLKKASGSASSSTHPPTKKAKLENVFNMEEDEVEQKPKRKLVPIDYSEDDDVGKDKEKKMSSDDRKKMIQNLVSSIPTVKEEVFAYELKWEAIDKALMEKRVGPWINKKIVEYIGEEEPTLTEFICNKLACHVAAGDILNDIAMVLDDEAEVFVLKLWRLLIYETEARHLGIAKNY